MEKSKKVGGMRLKIVLILLFCTIMLAACGKEKEGGLYDFEGVEPKEIDPWVYLQDTALSSNPQILGFASSAGGLAITIGVAGIVFSLLFMAIRLLFSGSAKMKNEIKEEALLKGVIAIMLFSIPLWLGVCKLVGDMMA